MGFSTVELTGSNGPVTVHRGTAEDDTPWQVTVDTALDAADWCSGVDMVFMDPPYNQGVDYGNGAGADRLPDGDYERLLRNLVTVGSEILRPGGSFWFVLPDEWVAESVVMAKHRGLQMRNWIKWHETFGVQTSTKFARTSRHLLYFAKPGPNLVFNADSVRVISDRQAKYHDRRANPRGKVAGDVWEFPRVAGTHGERCKDVPTQLPEAMLERLVACSTRLGDAVVEFCTGSGSLGRVCARSGRPYRGFESDPRTALVAAARIAEAAG